MVKVGERIRNRREELGWSQEKLAEEACLHRNTISLYERDETILNDLEILCRISTALKIQPYHLFSEGCLNILKENHAFTAYARLCDSLPDLEKIEAVEKFIEAASAFNSGK